MTQRPPRKNLRASRPPVPVGTVPSRGIRKLPSQFESLAAGEKPYRRPATRRPVDPRPHGLVPGVSNRDARLAYDARVRALLATVGEGASAERALGVGLCEAIWLGLWRCRQLTGFEAFAEDVVGIGLARALALAETHAAAVGVGLAKLPEKAVAMWLRAEAALLENNCTGGVALHLGDDGPLLSLQVPLAHAPEALAAIGERATALLHLLSLDAGPGGGGTLGGERRPRRPAH